MPRERKPHPAREVSTPAVATTLQGKWEPACWLTIFIAPFCSAWRARKARHDRTDRDAGDLRNILVGKLLQSRKTRHSRSATGSALSALSTWPRSCRRTIAPSGPRPGSGISISMASSAGPIALPSEPSILDCCALISGRAEMRPVRRPRPQSGRGPAIVLGCRRRRGEEARPARNRRNIPVCSSVPPAGSQCHAAPLSAAGSGHSVWSGLPQSRSDGH
jgi:hypothetical protein